MTDFNFASPMGWDLTSNVDPLDLRWARELGSYELHMQWSRYDDFWIVRVVDMSARPLCIASTSYEPESFDPDGRRPLLPDRSNPPHRPSDADMLRMFDWAEEWVNTSEGYHDIPGR